MQARTEQVMNWLDTFSEVATLAANPEAAAREIETLVSVFSAENADAALIDATFRDVKMTSQSRAWPTAATLLVSMHKCQRQRTGEHATAQTGGDRRALNATERGGLETKVIPTAKRWLRMYPALRDHARDTLEYWGEPLVDDAGKEWPRKKKTGS